MSVLSRGTFSLFLTTACPGAFIFFLKKETLRLLQLCQLISGAQLRCSGVCDAPAHSLYIPTVNTVYYIIHNGVLQRDGFQQGPSEYGTPTIVLTCCPISAWPTVALRWFSFGSLQPAWRVIPGQPGLLCCLLVVFCVVHKLQMGHVEGHHAA